MKSSMAAVPPMYGLRFFRPVRLACTPRGAVAPLLAVLPAACLARLATFPRRPRPGAACPGLLARAKREGEYVP